MIKSRYSDPALDGHGFVNHIHHIVRDMGVVPGTETPLIEAYKVELIQKVKATSGTGGKPRNLALFRKVLIGDPAAGLWQLLKMWVEGIDYNESSAAGTVDVLPDGTVHVVMAFGKDNAAGDVQYQPREATIPRSAFAPPIERLPGGEIGPSGPAGAGGVVLLPAVVTAPAWEARQLAGGVMVDIPSVFGVPHAASYLLRFVASASAPNVRVRVGRSEADPFFLTMNTQASGVQTHCQGWAPGPACYVSTVGGAALIWLQICGYLI